MRSRRDGVQRVPGRVMVVSAPRLGTRQASIPPPHAPAGAPGHNIRTRLA